MKNIVTALAVISFAAQAQTYAVKGLVSSASGPVQYAAVTFVDDSDTTRKYFAQTDAAGNYQIGLVTAVQTEETLPRRFELAQNYPNPFSTTTAISYHLATHAEARVTVYDILGNEVKTLGRGIHAAGAHTISWDGTNDSGARVAAGIYFYRLQAQEQTRVRKMFFIPSEGHVSTPLSKTNTARTAASEQSAAVNHSGGVFTIYLENTEDTFPVIAAKILPSVVIQNDTTLNLTADALAASMVYVDSTQQVIRGFGAANIVQWRPDMTANNIEKAFGTSNGQIGFSLLRLRIPPETNSFSLNVPTARAAYQRGVKLIASPWSPPASMKTNNNIVGGRLRESSYAAYAAHLKSFAELMANSGAPLSALSVQNEPDVSVTYESCDWNAAEMLKFAKENAHAIGAEVIAPESFNFNRTMSDPILNDSTAAAHVKIIGGHIYGGGLAKYPLAESKGKEVWMTEHLVLDTTWTAVWGTGKEIHDCMTAGMNAYIWWYIVRFYGPIHENGNVTKRGYVMSQFARFVRPGAFRVFATSPQRQIYITAYREGTKVVIVALNQSAQDVEQTFRLRHGDAARFTPYVTSRVKNCVQESEVEVSRKLFTATLEASSITTFVSN